jgi:hypothetical protein
MAEFLSADEAVARIPDGATLGMTGIVMCGVAEEVAVAIERAFRGGGHPRDLTLVHAAGMATGRRAGSPPRARGATPAPVRDTPPASQVAAVLAADGRHGDIAARRASWIP